MNRFEITFATAGMELYNHRVNGSVLTSAPDAKAPRRSRLNDHCTLDVQELRPTVHWAACSETHFLCIQVRVYSTT